MIRHIRRIPKRILLYTIYYGQHSELTVRINAKFGKLSGIVYLADDALYSAIQAGNTPAVDLLIELGANVHKECLLKSWYTQSERPPVGCTAQKVARGHYCVLGPPG